MEAHTLRHSLCPQETGCTHTMEEITSCVVCGNTLAPERTAVDTCGKVCRRRLATMQLSKDDPDRMWANLRGRVSS